MSNYNSLKTIIDANIKQNGNQEITGQILNSVLNQMVTTLGAGYQFAGIATIDTNPGTPDAKVFYIANGKGTYEKFGGIEVTEDDVVVLYWDTTWHKVSTGIASQEKLSELEGKFDKTENTIISVTRDNGHIAHYIECPSNGMSLTLTAISGNKTRCNFLKCTSSKSDFVQIVDDVQMGTRVDIVYDDTHPLIYLYYPVNEEPTATYNLQVNYYGIDSDIRIMREEIDLLKNETSPLSNEYNNPISGVEFGSSEGDLSFKNSIKKIWLISDGKDISQITNLYLLYFGNSTSAILSISSIKGDSSSIVFNRYYAGVKQTGTQTIYLVGSGVCSGMILGVEIDWDKTTKYFTSGLNTSFKLSLLNESPKIPFNGSDIINKSSKTYDRLVDWSGKTIVCFGDSLTEFGGSAMKDEDNHNIGYINRYSDYISEFTGAKTINVGVGGSMFSQRTTPVSNPSTAEQAYAALDIINMVKASCEQDFSKQISAANFLAPSPYYDDNKRVVERLKNIDWNSVDIVTIFGGTNDWYNNPMNFGTSGSNNVNTTLGAINEIIRMLLSTYKHLKIYWFTPIVRYVTPAGVSILDARVSSNWCDNYKNANNMTLKDFVSNITNEVVRHKIPICDFYNTLGWNEYNFGQYFPNNDNTHPLNSNSILANKIVGFITANREF